MSIAKVMQLGCLALMFGVADGLRQFIDQHVQEAGPFRDERLQSSVLLDYRVVWQ